MLSGIETGRDECLLWRPGIARLKGLETLRVVMELRLELKDVITLRRGFVGDDMVFELRRKGLGGCSMLLGVAAMKYIPRFYGNNNL